MLIPMNHQFLSVIRPSFLRKGFTAFSFFILLAFLGNLSAQHQELNEKPSIWKGFSLSPKDSSFLQSYFQKGKANGHFRYYFMSTDNEPGLTDYYAHAAGGGLRFETAPFYGLQFAVSGFYYFNIGSSDLSKIDSSSGQANRYEIGLFDVQNPSNRKNLDRLEELYVKYQKSKSSIIFGRQLVNTPFINLQDGRMRPTGVEGLWFDLSEWQKFSVEGGFLYAISPRGTVRWYGVDESIGIYPAGVDESGKKSSYPGQLESNGVAVLGFHFRPGKHLKIQIWDYLIHNIHNTAMIQVDAAKPAGREAKWIAGLQMVRQDAVGEGGNQDASKAYVRPGSKAMSLGGRTGWQNKEWDLSINYTRITDHGRYLFPREWGRDPFFTFLPRERNEGFGDLHAMTAKVQYSFRGLPLQLSLAGGYFDLPDVKNTRLNKYGMPSYAQANLDIRYRFQGFFKGMDAQFLVVAKSALGETYEQPRFIINKVNMVLYNLVLNYRF